jgi:DNA-binding response OmpR family regulator
MDTPIDILLIEDDIDDVDLLKEALDENNVPYKLQLIMEGDKVVEYLEQVRSLPGIIVMDLNLPKADGKEILSEIKMLDPYSKVPIIVLTTSSAREDVDYCHRMGIQKFITKPATIEGWNEAIEAIVNVASSASSAV